MIGRYGCLARSPANDITAGDVHRITIAGRLRGLDPKCQVAIVSVPNKAAEHTEAHLWGKQLRRGHSFSDFRIEQVQLAETVLVCYQRDLLAVPRVRKFVNVPRNVLR